MKWAIKLMALSCLLTSAHLAAEPNRQADEQAIRNILDKQIECWNKGDLTCFMSAYWKSDRLVFVGKNGPKFGWQAIFDNYKQAYPDRASMGKLAFDLVTLQPITDDAWYVVSKWSLSRQAGDASGYFTVLWKKIEGEWFIIADHSS